MNSLASILEKSSPAVQRLNAHQLVAERRKRHKHGAQPTERDGIRLDSKGEASRYDVLCQHEQFGIIAALEVKPRFELQPAFNHNGRTVRAITYTADFAYTVNGVPVVEDWKRLDRKTGKPYLTAEFKRTRKMFLYRYPGVNFFVNCDMQAVWGE